MSDKVEVEVYEFEVGDKIYHKFLDKEYLYHVRAIVDDTAVVTRRWSKRKYWAYNVEDIYSLTLAIDSGSCRLVKRKHSERITRA